MEKTKNDEKSVETGNAYWSQPIDALIQSCQSDAINGLRAEDAEARLQQQGPNSLKKQKSDSVFKIFLNQFKSSILIILIGATIISAFLGDWVDAGIILFIVLASAWLSFSEEYSASKAVESLQSQLTIETKTVRDGAEKSIPSENVVTGDIVLLSAGSVIPADGVILEAKDFFVNQAVLTGETFPVEKRPGVAAESASLAERTNCVFMGTNVSSGSARCLILHTGKRTAFGQIAGRLVLRPPETEFERGIKNLGYLLSEVMIVLVLLIFAVNLYFHRPVLDSLIFSIALAVGLTPQLLPAIININLSKGSKAMAERGVIVRRLEAIENFGSIDVLCTDKTGTITQGVVNADGFLDSEGNASPAVLLGATISAKLQNGLANQLDQAILRASTVSLDGIQKVDEIPYDFVRKRMSVLVKENGAYQLVTKGALKNILEISSQIMVQNQPQPLTAEVRQQLDARFVGWSQQGYRVLGLAQKETTAPTKNLTMQDEVDMVFIGFLLFFDPPKEDASRAIKELADLGVNLKIITGDNLHAATFIAEQVGLEHVWATTGSQLNIMRDEALLHVAEKSTVFAEVDPNQKERIIITLKKNGHVVGYMGDGINDAPSLHSADVGISVADAVDVAKQAADFVLVKNDLSVLKDGIIEGRKTFANTLKYVFMAVSANFGNMFSMAIAAIFLPFLPMLSKQILLINTLTDLPEMTIATDNVDDTYIHRPHRWNIQFIKHFMIVFGCLSSVFDIATFVILMRVLHAGESLFHTGWFVESILSAAVVVFVLRSPQPLGKCKPSRRLVLMTLGVCLFTLYLPFSPIAGLLGFVPLTLPTLLAILLIAAIYVVAAEGVKRIFYRRYQI